MAKTESGGVTIYKPSRGVKVALTISFALLLVLIANSLVGALWLASHQVWQGAIIFTIILVFCLFFFALNGLFLFAATHVEIRLDAEKCYMTLPNWRGPLPLFPYVEFVIPYRDIAAVETRNEMYVYGAVPVMLRASSFVRSDGRRFLLGYVRESSHDHSVPYHEIADDLARRAGVGVMHKGVVHGGSRLAAIKNDEPCWENAAPMDEKRLAALQHRESFLMRAAAIVFIGFVAVALVVQALLLRNGV